MDLSDLFDTSDQPKIRIKGLAKPAEPAPDPVSAQIADSLQEAEPESSGAPEDTSDLDVDIATRAQTAAQAHDAFSAAKASYDFERDRLQREVDEKLAGLKGAMLSAKETRDEAISALEAAMKKDKITTIPMTDRPDIKLKSSKGKKLGITKKWLVDPDHVAVKAYEAALHGNKSVEEEDGSVFVVPQSGKEFATKIWDEQPKSEASTTVVVPDAYEDEPDH